MTTSPKEWPRPPKIFSPTFSKNVGFFENIVRWKNIQNLIPHKKGYIHFRRQTPFSLRKRLVHQKQFFAVFSENTASFEKTAKQ